MSIPDTKEKAETFVRFMSFVEVGKEIGDCWTWNGSRPSGLYGHFSVDGKAVKAHRWMYEFIFGEIPETLIVRHKCDNPPCVNPIHLEIGTYRDNTIDKFSRGRGADRRGELHPLVKLKNEDVIEIRRLASCGKTHKEIAATYGLCRAQIERIIYRKAWRHIP